MLRGGQGFDDLSNCIFTTCVVTHYQKRPILQVSVFKLFCLILPFLAATRAACFKYTRIWLCSFYTAPALFCNASTVSDDVALIEEPIDLLQSEIGSFGVAEVLLFTLSAICGT
jgi:hypothetical protein